MTSRSLIGRFGWIVTLLLLCVSCGKEAGSGPGVAIHPVNGQVVFEGNRPPPEGAFVVFRPVKEMPELQKTGGHPRATVGKDGKFKLTTFRPDDGAPAGEYEVIITWHKPLQGVDEDGPDLLKGRYRDPAKSALPKITIKEGTNELPPIRLKAP
jgi:hypothetical protein